MSQRLVTIIDPSVEIVEVEKHVRKSERNGRIHQQTIRTEKRLPLRFFVQIDAKQGITHALERRRVRDALRVKGFPADHIKRNSDGTYTI